MLLADTSIDKRHPNILKIFDHYTSIGSLDVTHVTLPGDEHINDPDVQFNYLVPYTDRYTPFLDHFGWTHLQDCLYRNLYLYEYVAVFDYDEIFVPKNQPNWESMLYEILNISGTHDSYQFRNTYFMDKMQEAHGYEPDVPEYLTIMKHVYRSVISTDQTKSIHKTEELLAISLHSDNGCLGRPCRVLQINDTIASWHHYRSTCAKLYFRNNSCNTCNSVQSSSIICQDLENESVRDTSIWSVKDTVITEVKKVLGELEFL